ncbi:cytochrome P450 [Collybia nuda]|uniref:Cytochrome P450 n=1 Tax=Collybia nuda TaxID=64659 RepID=A0A9P6CB15_9AGAR|nr:cytochrome P450 [Collybia nuda]
MMESFISQVFTTTAGQAFVVAFLPVVVILTLKPSKPNPHGAPFPPGPPPRLLFGNLWDFPTVQPWLIYTQWKKQYGDIVYGHAMGQHVIILNSLKAVTDLFEKRSHIYSDRPVLPMRDVLGWEFVLGLMYYGDTWRKNRRILHQKYRPDAALAHRPTQMKKVHELLRNILAKPESFVDHYKYMAASIIMATVYGYESAPKGDPFLDNADRAITIMTNSMFPGANIVNAMSFLKYLPSWFPGSQFHSEAQGCRSLTREMLDLPYDFVKKNMADGVATPSLISALLEENEKAKDPAEEVDTIKGLGATAFSAGADTVACAVGSFFHAAAANPQPRKKAQEEIIRVTGGDRLPTFEDRPSLPYVEAFYREVMRWRPSMPMGVAHTSTEDDIYEGYFIPKGSTIMSNIWAITRDEEKYPDPDSFNPDRFFTADGELNEDNTILTFGFGRRLCIGRHAADASVWATIVSVLAVFNFENEKDSHGNVIPIEGKYTDALISHVIPFKCSIRPLYPEAVALIEATAMENSCDLRDDEL